MKANILQRFTNIFQKQMDVETYKKQLQSFWMEYESWWFEPLEIFQKEYQEKGGSFLAEKYIIELHNFEHELRSKNDVLTRFYNFMDKNYSVYINATAKERSEIRLLVRKQGKLRLSRKITFLIHISFTVQNALKTEKLFFGRD